MEFYLINLTYFLIALPIATTFFFIIFKVKKRKEEAPALIISLLSIMLFLIRFLLIFYEDTIGIMPYLEEDVIFYSLLTGLGLFMTWFYVRKVEKITFKDLGWKIDKVGRSVFYGILGFIPLISMFPLMIVLTDIQISVEITFSKLIVGVGFAVLGAFYEEIMFRGIIQDKLRILMDGSKLKIGILTAFIFTITHLFYLPFTGFGMYYVFVFIMAIILSVLREKVDQLACAILHGGIVFILIFFI